MDYPKYVKIQSASLKTGYIVPISKLKDEDWESLLEGCAEDDGYIIKVVDISDEDFEKLSEFMGF